MSGNQNLRRALRWAMRSITLGVISTGTMTTQIGKQYPSIQGIENLLLQLCFSRAEC